MNSLQNSIARIATWGKISGILTIIFGALSAIGGLFAYVVGAIPGIIQIILGYFLFQIGKEAASLKVNMEDEQAQLKVFDYLGKYVFWYGIMIIASIVLTILLIFFFFALFAAFLEMGL